MSTIADRDADGESGGQVIVATTQPGASWVRRARALSDMTPVGPEGAGAAGRYKTLSMRALGKTGRD